MSCQQAEEWVRACGARRNRGRAGDDDGRAQGRQGSAEIEEGALLRFATSETRRPARSRAHFDDRTRRRADSVW